MKTHIVTIAAGLLFIADVFAQVPGSPSPTSPGGVTSSPSGVISGSNPANGTNPGNVAAPGNVGGPNVGPSPNNPNALPRGVNQNGNSNNPSNPNPLSPANGVWQGPIGTRP